MTEPRIISDGYGRMVERGDPHGIGDRNRAPECRWTQELEPRLDKWTSLLDWAVYHAPGWEEWQVFRRSLIGQPMALRAWRVAEWWHTSPKGDPETELANAVRTVNVLRSLRGQFSANPELPELLARLNPELDRRWDRVRNQ